MTTAGKAAFHPAMKSAREENLQGTTHVHRLICANPSFRHAARKAEAQPAAALIQAAVIGRAVAAATMADRVVAITADQAVANPILLLIPRDRDAAAEHRGRLREAVIQRASQARRNPEAGSLSSFASRCRLSVS